MTDQLSRRIIEKINIENIEPLPRWRFIIFGILFWLLAIISITIGSFAISAIIFLFSDFGANGLFTVPHKTTEFLLFIPYVWLVLFILFMIISRECIEHTQKGYRYHFYVIIFASIFFSIFFGYVLNFFGFGKMTQEYFNEIPLYNEVTYDSEKAWDRPEIGRLAGIIVSIKDKNNFSIIDFKGAEWNIKFLSLVDNDFVIEKNSTVRMSGSIGSSTAKIFIADYIAKWEN